MYQYIRNTFEFSDKTSFLHRKKPTDWSVSEHLITVWSAIQREKGYIIRLNAAHVF